MDLVWPNRVLLLVQNSETGVNVSKITKNHIFWHFQVFVDKFCTKTLIINGTRYLITGIRHQLNIGWNNMQKIDLDGGKKCIKWNCRILWSAVPPERHDDFFLISYMELYNHERKGSVLLFNYWMGN